MDQGPRPGDPAVILSADATDELRQLLDFAAASHRADGGFGELDASGRLARDAPQHPLQTARMTFTFAIAALLDVPDTVPLAEHGVVALQRSLRGSTVDDAPRPEEARTAYLACFTALAAAAATQAGIRGGEALLGEVSALLIDRFWSEREGVVLDDPAPGDTLDYRGANGNMHAVEAFCALGATTGDPRWFDRATRIAERFIDRIARAADWMLPEHFDAEWEPLLDYNHDRLDDEFRPYGVTVGHLLEWSRLLLELHSVAPSEWMPAAARSLYTTARRVGWHVDGAPGFLYTVDWDGTPVVRTRPHWVTLEAIAAAATQVQVFADEEAAADAARFRAYADRYLRDRSGGSWHHELDAENHPSTRMWKGKPDAYHALGAILIPELPVAPGLAARILASSAPITLPEELRPWSPA